MKWGSEIEIERRRRIIVSIWAFAYERDDIALVPDYVYDEECLNINTQLKTNNDVLDKFFREEFKACTGMWIHSHPDINGIEQLYLRYYRK